MDALNIMCTKEAIENIKVLNDPLAIAMVLSACAAQRCNIGKAQPNSCKGCQFESHNCRELYNIAKQELKDFQTQEGGVKNENHSRKSNL